MVLNLFLNICIEEIFFDGVPHQPVSYMTVVILECSKSSTTRPILLKISVYHSQLVSDWVSKQNNVSLDLCVWNTSISFRNKLPTIDWSYSNQVFKLTYPNAIKFLTRSRVGLSHSNYHKRAYNFQNSMDLLCTCTHENESDKQILMTCHHYSNILWDLAIQVTMNLLLIFKITWIYFAHARNKIKLTNSF